MVSIKTDKRVNMKTNAASRLEGIGEYYFSQKLAAIERMNATGRPVINLGIGSPDLPPHPSVIEELLKASQEPGAHAYQSYRGIPVLRTAIKDWYQRWYGVNLDAAFEILPLIGSKEGIVHISMSFLNEGDEVLVPDPGYPAYTSATRLSGATPVPYQLREEKGWQPDWQLLEAMDLSRVKLMWVNYPHMPTGCQPDEALFRQLIAFGKKKGILICHDNPYSFILNDRPLSILAVEGAKETAIELNSLSKSHNMAGWRVGMLCGSREHIDTVLRFKSNMDSGMFQPVQRAAARALQLGQEWYADLNALYRKRREKAAAILESIGCYADPGQTGLFLWAGVPAGSEDGYVVSDRLLEQARVFITPGGIFGEGGRNYLRISLCSPEEKLDEALERISTLNERTK
jgi:LL-diaminopimelate aminotransferase